MQGSNARLYIVETKSVVAGNCRVRGKYRTQLVLLEFSLFAFG